MESIIFKSFTALLTSGLFLALVSYFSSLLLVLEMKLKALRILCKSSLADHLLQTITNITKDLGAVYTFTSLNNSRNLKILCLMS